MAKLEYPNFYSIPEDIKCLIVNKVTIRTAMFNMDNNFSTNGSDGNYSDGYKREDLRLINFYLALPLRIIMSLAIITSASIVLLAVKKSKRTTRALDFFFIANLMIADIGVAVMRNGVAILNMILTIANPMRKGTDCRIIAVTAFPIAADPMMLAALCFDRLYSVIAPHHYGRNMTKKRGYVIVSTIWLASFLLSFLSFTDPHLSSTKSKGAVCGAPLYKNFGLVVIILPLVLSAVFVVIQNIYLYCVVVKITTRSDTNNSHMTVAGALRTLKETKKASTILSILSGTSIIFGVAQPITSTIIQRLAGYALFKAIWFALIIPFVYSLSILLHSVLYGYFLHSIRESLGLNICQCFRNLSERSST